MSLPPSSSSVSSGGCSSRDGPSTGSGNTGRGHKEDELVTVYTLRDHDVLFGRGSGPNGFAGNVRYRNLIRSILIKACCKDMLEHDKDDDASIIDGGDLDFFLPDNNDREISVSRRNRILATQVVKAIKSRNGRFLQRVSSTTPLSSSSSQEQVSVDHSASNHIERIMYREVDESTAIEKTKQNFRDQMRLLQTERRGAKATTCTKKNECCEDSWGQLPSHHINTLSLVSPSGGKRKRINEEYPPCTESLVHMNKVTKRFLARPQMLSQKIVAIPYESDIVANRSCLSLPARTTENSLNLLARSSSVPSASLYHKDDMIIARALSHHTIPLSRLGSNPTRDIVSYRRLPIAMQQPFIPEVMCIRYNNDACPSPLLEHHIRKRSNMIMHAQEDFVDKDDPHYFSHVVLSLGGPSRTREDMHSHRLVATTSSIPTTTTTLSMTPILSSNNHRSRPPLIATPVASSSTTGRVEAMIASHQSRRDRFWMGWAKASKK